MKLKFKLLSHKAVAPCYATDGSAGFDLTVARVKFNKSPQYVEYGFDIAFEIPKGHVGILAPRSSISNTRQLLSNSIGVIDSDYRGSVSARMVYDIANETYNIGDRAVQMFILELPKIELMEVDELNDTKRGTGGYGSTGV